MSKGVQSDYCRDRDLEAVADKLIELFYEFLIDEIQIVVVRRSQPFKKYPNRVAQIEKVFGLRGWLWHPVDNTPGAEFFLITIADPLFEQFDAAGKIAVIDHEICHIEINEDFGTLGLRDHAIEEFPEIVERHGAYHHGLRTFYDALQRGEQNTDSREEILRQIAEG